MAQKITKPAIIKSAGNKPKTIAEYIGLVNTGTSQVSMAQMSSPAGWIEPGQTPDFDEYTLVLKGMLRVNTKTEIIDVAAGEAIIAPAGKWVQYSTPGIDGAEYISVCAPAFSPQTVHRDE